MPSTCVSDRYKFSPSAYEKISVQLQLQVMESHPQFVPLILWLLFIVVYIFGLLDKKGVLETQAEKDIFLPE